jgi:Armadillo/beta-catenin-like repeat
VSRRIAVCFCRSHYCLPSLPPPFFAASFCFADVLVDALWALSYYTDVDEGDQLQACIEAGVCRRLAALLRHDSPAVVTPALRALGNIVTGDEIQTQVIINAGALHSLGHILDSGKRAVKKEACWAVSNVMAGNKEQIQAAIDANLVQQLVNILKTGHQQTKREACWALSNATSGGTADQLLFMVRAAVIPELAAMMQCDDAKIALVAMEGLENILRAGGQLAAEGKVAEGAIKELCETAMVPDALIAVRDTTDDQGEFD